MVRDNDDTVHTCGKSLHDRDKMKDDREWLRRLLQGALVLISFAATMAKFCRVFFRDVTGEENSSYFFLQEVITSVCSKILIFA